MRGLRHILPPQLPYAWRAGPRLETGTLLKLNKIEAADYRQAMSHFAGAVHVVTTDGAAGRRGVTVTAACSVSDNPATLLVCLNHNNPLNAVFDGNGVFCLNTLTLEHEHVSVAFSGKGHLPQEERFAMAAWETLETGAPLLLGAAAAFDCKIVGSQDVATHRVLFGEVIGLRSGGVSKPLIYHSRGYHSLG
jgi:cob(II)yrinic acid a,c-diamide reductase